MKKTSETANLISQNLIPAKKPYRTPCLVEWGSIIDLTRGGSGGFDDIPMGGVGGTGAV